MRKRYLQIHNKPLIYQGKKCTAYQINNANYIELDQDKVKLEFGESSICYVVEENKQIKYVSSGDLKNEKEFQKMIEDFYNRR
ncbi:MAG: hypothetical protein ACK48V_09675 [Crocinitomicaceae bacterium]|jgi:hypothetical protein